MRNGKLLFMLVCLALTFTPISHLLALEEVNVIALQNEEYKAFKNYVMTYSLLHQFENETLLAVESYQLDILNEKKIKFSLVSKLKKDTTLLLIAPKTPLKLQLIKSDFSPIFFKDDVAIVDKKLVKEDDFPLAEYQVLPLNLSSTTHKDNPEYTHIYQPEVLNSFSYISKYTTEESWNKNVEKLEEYHSRYFLNNNRYDIIKDLSNQLKSYNIPVEIDSFFIEHYEWGNFPQVWQSNVIGTIEGSLYPNNYLIIGAHYDSIISPLYGNPMITAPGADDNGSGVATLLEVAKAVWESGYEPKKSIKFILFGAEEIGLKGSSYLAEKFNTDEVNIELMINNDMVAYTEIDDTRIKIHPYSSSIYLSDVTSKILENYTSLTPVISTVNNPASDSYPFAVANYPSVFFHEYNFSPHYHSPDDLLKNCSSKYAIEVTKATLYSILYFDNIPPPVQNLVVSNVGDGTSISLDWEHTAEHNYNLYIGNDPSELIQVAQTTNNSFILEDLKNEEVYCVGVSVLNDTALESLICTETVKLSSIPETPSKFSVDSTEDYISLKWEPNKELDIDKYVIYRSTSLDNIKNSKYAEVQNNVKVSYLKRFINLL